MNKIPDKEKHHRRSIRLKEYDYALPGAYFVTICTQKRECLFGEVMDGKMRLNKTGKMIKLIWDELPENYPGVNTDVFVVMPNHIHGIIVLSPVGATPRGCPPPGQAQGPAPTISLPDVIHRFKSLTTTRYRQNRTRNILHSLSERLWQRNYYEHVIRNEEKLNLIRRYILYNPLQWQYDRENPEYIQDKNYDVQWADFEKLIYGKQNVNRQDVCST